MSTTFRSSAGFLVFFLLFSVGFANSVGVASIDFTKTEHGSQDETFPSCSAAVKVESAPNAWRGLVPLRSMRADVERLLGKPVSSRDSVYVYETDQEKVNVVYSAGACKLSRSEMWNAPKDVLITLEIRPSKIVLIQYLHLDPRKFRRVQESHPENWFFYRNKDEGVMVETVLFRKNEQVDSISYFPTTKDNNLRCASHNNPSSKKSQTIASP
jgi:hypothetical protein